MKMKKTLIPLCAVGAVACVSGTVLAAPETYILDNDHTFPRFPYSHFGYSTQLSRFDKTSGSIVIDRAAKICSVDVIFFFFFVIFGYGMTCTIAAR